MDQTKSIIIQRKRLEIAEERRARLDKANERARAKRRMENPTSDTPIIRFDYKLEQLYYGRKRNVHLVMRNLKQTELHRLKNRGKKG